MNSYHDRVVESLADRLQAKNRYFAVGTEIPLYKTRDSIDEKVGQADIITIDKKHRRITYWEVKTGSHHHGYRKAQQQANKFYTTQQAPGWELRFVYYNPKEKIVCQIRPLEK